MRDKKQVQNQTKKEIQKNEKKLIKYKNPIYEQRRIEREEQ